MMLEDDDYIDSVVNIIETQQVNAEFAVATTGDNFAKMFAEMEDDYFKARGCRCKRYFRTYGKYLKWERKRWSYR